MVTYVSLFVNAGSLTPASLTLTNNQHVTRASPATREDAVKSERMKYLIVNYC